MLVLSDRCLTFLCVRVCVCFVSFRSSLRRQGVAGEKTVRYRDPVGDGERKHVTWKWVTTILASCFRAFGVLILASFRAFHHICPFFPFAAGVKSCFYIVNFSKNSIISPQEEQQTWWTVHASTYDPTANLCTLTKPLVITTSNSMSTWVDSICLTINHACYVTRRDRCGLPGTNRALVVGAESHL